MYCPHCNYWNWVGLKYCTSCGKPLDVVSIFRIDAFFEKNKDLFIIFGVFGAISLYLTTFLNNNPITFEIGILEFNALKLGVSSSLLLLLLIATVIIIRAFSYPKKEKIPLFFIIGPGAIWRLSFSIPFIILNLGLTYYLYKSFSTELTQILVIYAFIIGILIVFLGIVKITKRFGNSNKIIFIYALSLLCIFYTLEYFFTPMIPSSNIAINVFFSLILSIRQGAVIIFLFSIFLFFYEYWKKRRQVNQV